MDWSWADPRIWAAIVIVSQFVLFIANGLWRKQFASNETVDQVKTRADDAHHRLDLLDQRVKSLPDFDTVNEMRRDIGDMKQEQAAANAKLDMIQDAVGRMDDFLRATK
jgi:hypothetical protein